MPVRPPLSAALLALAVAVAACAPPPEADAPVSERTLAAPAPMLEPTARFTEPLEAGTEAVARLGPERDALAARAAALRTRGEALSAAPVLDDDRRGRLDPPPGDDAAEP